MMSEKVVDIKFLNTSGIQPLDLRVVVTPIKEQKDGLIVIPDPVRDRHEMAGIKARLVAIGAQAFKEIKDPDQRPIAGAVVAIARYSGYLIRGKDGEEYRIINDDDVVAVLDGDWDITTRT